MPPSRDDFARWRDDHVTKWVLAALEADARAQKATWDDASWNRAAWDPNGVSRDLLIELRTRADAYRAMAELNYEGVCEALGDKPRDE